MAPATQLAAQVAAPRAGRRLPVVLGIGVLVVAAIAAPVAFASLSGGHPGPAAATTAATGAQGTGAQPTGAQGTGTGTGTQGTGGASNPAAPGPTVGQGTPPASQDALRPTGLAVTIDAGASVTLRWALAPGSEKYNLFVQVVPQDPGRTADIIGVGRTSYTVTGLNPATGYCFRVGPILGLGTGGQAGTVAWSQSVCIRGAAAGTIQ
jgi:hypothetical protein